MFGRISSGIRKGDCIPLLVDLHMNGRFPLDRLATYYNLEQINEALEDSKQGRTIKPILRIPG